MIFNRSKSLAKFEPKKKYLYSVVEYAIYSPVSVQVLCRKNDVVDFDAYLPDVIFSTKNQIQKR